MLIETLRWRDGCKSVFLRDITQARNRQLTGLALGLSLLFASCSFRNPNEQKRGYLNSGEKYLAAGKFKEAAIEFQNALQIDPRFAEADYQLAITYRSLVNLTKCGPIDGDVQCSDNRSLGFASPT